MFYLLTLLETAEQIQTMQIRGAGKIAQDAVAALRDHAETIMRPVDVSAFFRETEHTTGVLLATRSTVVSLPNAIQISDAGCPDRQNRGGWPPHTL